MKHLTAIASSAVCFVLGTLVPIAHTHAQTEPAAKETFYNISFMKSRPGQNPMAMERDDWTAIHQDLLKSGVIKSWTVLSPLYGGPHDYDYMTIIAFSDMNAYNNIDYASLFKKHWGDKMQETMKRTGDSRDQVGNEVWSVVASVDGTQPAAH